MNRPVIVLDGNTKQALCIVRSLGVKNITVHCGAERTTALACFSRYITSRFVYPSPKNNQQGFIDELIEKANEVGDRPLVYACSDATVCTLFTFRGALQDVCELVLPSERSIELAFDKGATYSEARVHGIPAVKTYIREREVEVEQLVKELVFPAVVKPRHSMTWKDGVGVFGTAQFAMDGQVLVGAWKSMYEKTGEAPLIQPFMKGEEYGVEMLANEGVIVAQAVHHRIRSMSPRGGASVVKETVEETELVSTMKKYSEALVEILHWRGPIMIEWKVDPDTREPKLMEINGRWWGSLPLAQWAGVDFPYLFYQMFAEGIVSNERMSARPFVTSRHFLGDVRHLLRVLFSRDPMRSELYPSRRLAFRDFFKNSRETKSDVWRWNDPIPSVMEYVDVIMSIWK